MSSYTIEQFEHRAAEAEKIIDVLCRQIKELENYALKKGEEELLKENEKLRKEVNDLKLQLVGLEKNAGIPQYYDFQNKVPLISNEDQKMTSVTANISSKVEEICMVKKEDSVKAEEKETAVSKSKKEKKKEKVKETIDVSSDELPADVGRLNFKIGKIISARKHPDADSLYIEDIDIGEEKTRTVVSGLVKFVPLEDMQQKMVVALCNLKPARMRGITSEAMVMCASSPEKVEILEPPDNCCPGDIIEFEGYERNPDTVLNPKKKVFETCLPDLRTDGECCATYKGVFFSVPEKGIVKAPSLANVQIK